MVFLGPEASVESVLITSGTDAVVPIFHDLAEAISRSASAAATTTNFRRASLSFSLQVDRSMRGVARVGAWVDELAILLNLAHRTEYALRLCLEEAVTNIVTHARPVPGVDGEKVGLRLIAEPSQLCVTLQDQCEEYNPLQQWQHRRDTGRVGRGRPRHRPVAPARARCHMVARRPGQPADADNPTLRSNRRCAWKPRKSRPGSPR